MKSVIILIYVMLYIKLCFIVGPVLNILTFKLTMVYKKLLTELQSILYSIYNI